MIITPSATFLAEVNTTGITWDQNQLSQLEVQNITNAG